MTNKLPEVGKKYRFKDAPNCVFTIRFIDLGVELENNHTTSFTRKNIEDFNNIEELPEDKAETTGAKNAQVEIKPETQSHISELSPEVKEAMERLRNNLKSPVDNRTKETLEEEFVLLECLIRNLLTALDKQFMLKEGGKIDTKQDNVDSIDKEESIWKPVSEIPRWNINGFVKFNDSDYLSFGVLQGNYLFFGYDNNLVAKVHEEDRFMSITDFINEHNDMKKRIAKLESIR